VKISSKTLGVIAVLALACGDESDQLKMADPGGSFTVTPKRWDFPETPLGSGASADFVVQNLRGSEATIDVVTIEGINRDSFSVSPDSIIKIGPQRSVKLTVQFTPKARGELRAEIVIYHTVPSTDPLRVIVTGKGAQCLDLDQDGFGEDCIPGPDCDDNNRDIHPGVMEICDGKDNNCDGQDDEDLSTKEYFHDFDGDMFGNDDVKVIYCKTPTVSVGAYVEFGGDCNDRDGDNYPGNTEICDGKDNNCDEQIDEGLAKTFYEDFDADMHGSNTSTVSGCEAPAGYVEGGGDCDDRDGMNFPGNTEICDGKDNNCDQNVDEGLLETYYLDGDGDTYGLSNTTTVACQMPAGYAARGGDCDDRYTVANPMGIEVCTGGIDEDCDGLIDAADPDCGPPMPTTCSNQNDCGGLNAAGEVCPMIGSTPEICADLCRERADCTGTNVACRPLPGSASLGFCQAATGATQVGGACTATNQCADGICVQNACRAICQSQRDCGGNDVCGTAIYNTTELGGRNASRLTTVCRPLAGRQPIGGSCAINANNADTGLCATEHCDLPPWSYFAAIGGSGPANCAAVCTNVDDCGAGQVCGLVYNGLAERPVLQSTGEGAGRYYEAILGCYTPYYRTSAALGTWQYYPAGNSPIGTACNPIENTQASHTCRSRLCAVPGLPNAGQCTRYCQSDSDCMGTLTPSWRCRWGDKNLTGIFVQSYDIADATKFTLLGICAP